MLSLAADVKRIYDYVFMNPKPIGVLTEADMKLQAESSVCHICKKGFNDDSNFSVRDHCHFTGRHRGPAHNECNLLYRVPRFIPIFFHNFSGYDCHLFIKLLMRLKNRLI